MFCAYIFYEDISCCAALKDLKSNILENDGDSIFNSYINKFNQVNPYVQDLKTKRNELQNITNSNLFLNEKLPESNLYCLVENDDNSSLDPFLKSDNKQVFADYARNKIRA